MFVTAGVDLKFHDINQPSSFTYKPISFGNIISVSWSKDNGFITILNESAQPEIISVKNQTRIRTVHIITAVNDVSVVSFQKTTKRFIGLGTYSGQAVLYDTKNKEIHQQFQDVNGAINQLDFNHGGRQMAVSSLNGDLYIFDVEKINAQKIYGLPNGYGASALRFHSNDKKLLQCGVENGLVMHWDIEAAKNVYCNQLHSAQVTGVALINNADTYISVGYDNKFCIHNSKTNTCLFRSNLQHPLTSVDTSPERNTVAIGSLFGDLYIYDVRNLIMPLATDIPHNSKINKISFETTKLKDVLLNDIPESSISLQPEIKFIQNSSDAKVNDSDVNITCANYTENVYKENDNESLKSVKFLKQEVADAVRTCAEELQTHIVKQMGNLQDFILNEFKMICNGIENKWDFQNLGFSVSDEIVDAKTSST